MHINIAQPSLPFFSGPKHLDILQFRLTANLGKEPCSALIFPFKERLLLFTPSQLGKRKE